MQTPTIDVDCSNVCYKVGRTAQSVANFLVRWSKIGINITPVGDGEVRPSCKQATNKRKGDREKNRIKAFILRRDVLTLQSKLKNDSLCESERNDIREEIASKQKSMKAKESQSSNVIQSNFEDKLVEELEKRKPILEMKQVDL